MLLLILDESQGGKCLKSQNSRILLDTPVIACLKW